MSFKKLSEKIIKKNNPTVMGLDPKLEYIPEHIQKSAVEKYGKTLKAAGESLFLFNKGLIDACCEYIPAIKPQSAYYEMYGLDGIEALYRTIEYAKDKDLYVILDAKRGDIGSTAEAYSSAYLGFSNIFGENKIILDADCLTVNPYLGIDGVKPFIDDCIKYDKSIFILVKTSNRSSGDFQDIVIKEADKPLYEVVGEKVEQWGREANKSNERYNPAGAVVGATYPRQLKVLREKMPNTFFLIPGYGAQGGSAEDIKPAFDKDGLGAIVNSSRAIMCAYQKANPSDSVNYDVYAREEVLKMKIALNNLI